MNFTGDYHTHTKYSKVNHGKNTVKEMVEKANELGLAGYGIADHGPKHLLFGIRRKNIKKLREDIDREKENSKAKLYMGIEANLIGRDGSIDLNENEIKMLDHLLVGYHRGTITNFVSFFRRIFNPKKQKQINTEAYINCLNKYNVAIITHINTYIEVDLYEVAKVAKEKGTLIELNNKHINYSKEQIKQLIDSGCDFIVSSDAHKEKDILNFEKVIEFIEKYDFPKERIVNLDRIYK